MLLPEPEDLQPPQPMSSRSYHKVRMLVAKSFASTKPKHAMQKKYDDGHRNPPVWEQSHSVTSFSGQKNSATSLPSDLVPKETAKEKKGRPSEGDTCTVDKAIKNQTAMPETNLKTLRSRTINISTKIKQPVKKAQGRNIKEQGNSGNTAQSSEVLGHLSAPTAPDEDSLFTRRVMAEVATQFGRQAQVDRNLAIVLDNEV